MGLVCQASSSSLGVVIYKTCDHQTLLSPLTWSPFSLSRSVTQTTADLIPAMKARGWDTKGGGSGARAVFRTGPP